MNAARLRDMLVAMFCLVLVSPVFAGVALLILVTDGPPIMFRQSRSGFKGRVFFVNKFRTMDSTRDEAGELLSDARRTTRLGRVLRVTRIDELPQLWSVLIGEMSLVGPRPLLPETVEHAGARGSVRSLVRPGITGWAQVNGNALLSDADKIALDCWYVANRSWALDFLIICRTVTVILKGERIDAAAIRNAYASSSYRGG
jgi:lipopolysaccharide/colanic/teichoic acid biosynthesis glycosyltransferase